MIHLAMPVHHHLTGTICFHFHSFFDWPYVIIVPFFGEAVWGKRLKWLYVQQIYFQLTLAWPHLIINVSLAINCMLSLMFIQMKDVRQEEFSFFSSLQLEVAMGILPCSGHTYD